MKILQEWIKENLLNENGTLKNSKKIKNKYPEQYNEILKLTSFLNVLYDEVDIKQRIGHIKNNKVEPEYCCICKINVVNFKKNKYNMVCCKKCQNKYIGSLRINEGNPSGKGGVKKQDIITYKNGKSLIEKSGLYIDYRKNPDKNILQVSCDWCGKGYNIKYSKLYNFIRNNHNNSFLHCSDQCSNKNPLYSKNGKLGVITNFKGGEEWALYDTYSPKIKGTNETKREKDTNALLVKCYHCDKWFRPTKMQVGTRLNGLDNGTCNFYCSDDCKSNCIVFRSRKFYKNNRPYENQYINGMHPELRKLVFERDRYECQICGCKVDLVCHHIDPISNNPIESADTNNCITLCKDCHKNVHKLPRCSTGYLATHCNLI